MTTTPDGSLKILVVDDEPAMVGALGALLGQAGHRIVAAYDGDEALRRFREDAPDLVLLDLAMPGLDGATVCQRIREMSDTPIVVVSGERDRAATVELLDLGADDYIRKPFRADELLARVRAVARRTAGTPRVRAQRRGRAGRGERLGAGPAAPRDPLAGHGRARHGHRVPPAARARRAPGRGGARTTTCSRPAGPTCRTPTRCGSSRTWPACARSWCTPERPSRSPCGAWATSSRRTLPPA